MVEPFVAEIQPGLRRTSSFVHHAAHTVSEKDIANKATILDEIDQFFGYDRPPAVEFVLVETVTPDVPLVPSCAPLRSCGWGGWGLSFGHAACRYTMPDGKTKLVNITKGTGEDGEGDLVEFWENPADYYFGVRGEHGKGGVFSRPMALIRVQARENVPSPRAERSIALSDGRAPSACRSGTTTRSWRSTTGSRAS